jgi:hypothetical protein
MYRKAVKEDNNRNRSRVPFASQGKGNLMKVLGDLF